MCCILEPRRILFHQMLYGVPTIHILGETHRAALKKSRYSGSQMECHPAHHADRKNIALPSWRKSKDKWHKLCIYNKPMCSWNNYDYVYATSKFIQKQMRLRDFINPRYSSRTEQEVEGIEAMHRGTVVEMRAEEVNDSLFLTNL